MRSQVIAVSRKALLELKILVFKCHASILMGDCEQSPPSTLLYFNVCVTSCTDNFKSKFEHYCFRSNSSHKDLTETCPILIDFLKRIIQFSLRRLPIYK